MLKGHKTLIRPLDSDDIELFYQWYNDQEVNLWSSGAWPLNTLLSKDELEGRFFDPDSDEHRYAITNLQHELIGTLGFREVNIPAQSATLFIVIGDKNHWGQGYGTDALKTFLHFLFGQWNFHRLSLDTWDGNLRAIKAYEKLGFVLEGKLRDAHFVEGQYHDAVIFGLLRSEFFNHS
ncbi:GNAT family N-acetyltransferase [Desulfitobacterium metallireducens]|uniref:Acetyltransferase n=1 Tax=Desulfitobacterium metallireducens DSM 15288 TaxID=871968 RepID=W0ECF8_9FIRM|nr:GNAT family protein [Desulfitobacterium metallireducens]AHF06894.1 acetyltransferase [Desulfitobacterium metallireducens DSM 15288]